MSESSDNNSNGKKAPSLRERTVVGSSIPHEELFSMVYDELYGLARRSMSGQRAGHTLQPTALVNEVYLKLANGDDRFWDSRDHFLNSAAQSMRHILVDYARMKNATKRKEPGERMPLDQILEQFDERSLDLLALNEELGVLEAQDPRLVQIVEMHFFGGCTFEEIAQNLQSSVRTVQRDWKFARTWLHRRLGGAEL